MECLNGSKHCVQTAFLECCREGQYEQARDISTRWPHHLNHCSYIEALHSVGGTATLDMSMWLYRMAGSAIRHPHMVKAFYNAFQRGMTQTYQWLCKEIDNRYNDSGIVTLYEDVLHNGHPDMATFILTTLYSRYALESCAAITAMKGHLDILKILHGMQCHMYYALRSAAYTLQRDCIVWLTAQEPALTDEFCPVTCAQTRLYLGMSVRQTTWTLHNHLSLRDSRLNQRAMVAILCMRRTMGGSRKVRPLHIFQTLKFMRMLVVVKDRELVEMLN